MISHGIDWNAHMKILLSRTNVVSHDFINIIYICQMRDKLNSQNELLSGTVHLWKSRNMGSKGYIHCTWRRNLRKWKYRFTLIESLPNPDNSNSYRTLQALIDGVNIWTATWLYNIVLSENIASWILDPRSAKRETQSSRLETRSSHLKTRSNRALRCEDRVSSFELRVSTYF